METILHILFTDYLTVVQSLNATHQSSSYPVSGEWNRLLKIEGPFQAVKVIDHHLYFCMTATFTVSNMTA